MRQKSHEMNTITTKWVLGHKLTAYPMSGNYDLMLGETLPQVPGPPPHYHNSYTESFLIVEGQMEFMMNGETKLVKAGESVDIPPKTLHTFTNKHDATCRWVNIHSPKGFGEFFSQIGIEAEESNAQEKSVAPELIQKVIASASDHDMVIELQHT